MSWHAWEISGFLMLSAIAGGGGAWAKGSAKWLRERGWGGHTTAHCQIKVKGPRGVRSSARGSTQTPVLRVISDLIFFPHRLLNGNRKDDAHVHPRGEKVQVRPKEEEDEENPRRSHFRGPKRLELQRTHNPPV